MVNENLDTIRGEVEETLPVLDLQSLLDVCEEINLPIVDMEMKYSKNKLYRYLLTYLWSEVDEDDEGMAVYKIVHSYIVRQAALHCSPRFFNNVCWR